MSSDRDWRGKPPEPVGRGVLILTTAVVLAVAIALGLYARAEILGWFRG